MRGAEKPQVHIWPYLLLAFAPLTWGGNLIVGRTLAGAVDPTTLNAVRWSGAALILLPLCGRAFWAHRAALWAQRRLVLALGLTGIGGFHLLQYGALAQTSVLHVALLTALTPLYVVIIAWALSGDRLDGLGSVGVVLSIVGAIVVVSGGDVGALLSLQLRSGDLIQVVAILFWSIYTVLLRYRPPTIPGLPFLLATLLPGLALTLLTYVMRAPSLDWSPTVGLGLGYLVLFPSTLAYVAWGAGIAALGPQVGGAFSNLVPIYGALLAIVLLGEPLHLYHLVAAVSVGLGIWLVSRPAARVEKESG